MFWIVAALSSMFAGTWLMQWSEYIGVQCPAESGSGDACFSASGLVRISLTLALFQFVIFSIVLMRNDAAAVIHDGWWGLKFIMVGCLFVGSMWVPNEPFVIQYMKFARVVSIVYLSYQAILMLIVAFVINNTLVQNVSNYGDGRATSCPGLILILIFIAFTGSNLALIIFQFKKFSGCSSNVWIMSITCLLAVLMYGIVFLRTRADASILTSSIILSYFLYLQWSAMSQHSDPVCNPFS